MDDKTYQKGFQRLVGEQRRVKLHDWSFIAKFIRLVEQVLPKLLTHLIYWFNTKFKKPTNADKSLNSFNFEESGEKRLILWRMPWRWVTSRTQRGGQTQWRPPSGTGDIEERDRLAHSMHVYYCDGHLEATLTETTPGLCTGGKSAFTVESLCPYLQRAFSGLSPVDFVVGAR